MATINADKTITYDTKYSNYTLDADGNIISKSGWDLYEYLVDSSNLKRKLEDGSIVSATTIFGMDIVVTGTKGKDWQTDKSFVIENTSESYATNFSNFDVDKPKIPKETGHYYGVSGCNTFATKHNYKNGYCLIVADKLKYYNRSLQCTKEELAKLLYNGHLKYFFVLKDKEIVFVDGNGNPLVYDYYSGEISTKHPYFLGYKNASKTAKPIIFPVDVRMDRDLINNLTILNSFYCVDDSTTLISNKKSVVKGMRIECEFLKNPEGIPSIVCFNGSNPLPDKSTWLTGNFTFEIPSGVTDIIIQCQCDYENTRITAYMPDVLLVAAYKTNVSGDSYPINYILYTDIIKEKEVLPEGVPSYGDKYETNYIVQSGVKKIWVTSKSSGNVSLKLNTKKKTGIINYYDKDETYLPKNAGSVESVAYTVLYNRIKLLENSNSRVQYKNLIGSPTKLSEFINDCNYATLKNISGTTINVSNEWGDLVNKPSWITMEMPDASYFGGVPTSRKINGMPLTEDITIEVGGGGDKGYFVDSENIDNTIKTTKNLYLNNFKFIVNSKIGDEKKEPTSANTNYFEWDSINSALSFNGNLYVTGGISALGKLDISGYTPVIVYDGLDGTDSKVALAATQGKILDTRIKYLENNTVTSLPWSGITGKPTWLINAGNSKPTYTVAEISGAVPNTLKINGSALTSDITIQTGDPKKITDGTYTLTTTGGAIGGNLRLKDSTNYGCKLNFGDGDYCYLYEDRDGHLKIHADKGIILEYIDKIYFKKNVTESDYFQYDSTNGALKYNGSFYATGGISSMGFQTSTGGDVTATKITVNEANVSGCTISNSKITFKNGGYIDNTTSGKLRFCGDNSESIVTIDNQSLTTSYLMVSSDDLYYSNNKKVSSQFGVIKTAFNNYSTLSEIKNYIINNLK